jgi:hypothetical protein
LQRIQGRNNSGKNTSSAGPTAAQDSAGTPTTPGVPEPVETPIAEVMFTTEWTLPTSVTPDNIRDTGAETGTLKVEIPTAGAPNSRDARTDGNKINRRDVNHSGTTARAGTPTRAETPTTQKR